MTQIQVREDLPALTGLRFVAAALIVAAHLRGKLGVPADFLWGVPLENGVSFFFVLSGFILAHAHPSLPTAGARRRFYLGRFARVWPLHIVCMLLVLIAIGNPERLGTNSGWLSGTLNVTLLQSWVPSYPYFLSFNSVSWSLSVEAFFYLMFPIIVWRFRQRAWMWLGICVGTVVGMVSLAQVLDIGPMRPGFSELSLPGFVYANPAVRLLEFVVGIGTAHVWARTRDWLDESTFRADALQIVSVCLLAVSYAAANEVARMAHHAGSLPLASWLRSEGVTFLASAFVVYAFASQRGALRNLLSRRPAIYLGEVSFAIYLFHQIPINFHDLQPERFTDFQNLYGAGVMVCIIMAGAALLHHLIEVPARRAIVGRFDAVTHTRVMRPAARLTG